MNKKYQTALIIGRFQPFHNGHLYLFETALEIAETITIAIGSANSEDFESNPLSFEHRKNLIEAVAHAAPWSKRVNQIVASNDYPDDKQWLDSILSVAGEFDIAIGNNEWTNGVLEDAGYKTMTIPLKNRDEYQGVVIRALIRNAKDWQDLVPESVSQNTFVHTI